MPICQDCGNETAFEHEVNGTETRVYDPDTGEFDGVDTQSLNTTAITCAECGSSDVKQDSR